MSDEPTRAHPAPARHQLPSWKVAFLLLTGPLAWFVQLNVGVMLTSWACFPSMERRVVPLQGYGWTGAAAVVVLLACAGLAAMAGWSAWRTLNATMDEDEGGHNALAEIGHGRTRFVALWGTILGGSFTVATLVTLVAFLLVPRCLG